MTFEHIDPITPVPVSAFARKFGPHTQTESFAHFCFQDQLDPEEIRRFLTRSGVTIGDSRDKIHHVTLIVSGVYHD
jgi:hypothetical protein